jgi:hypothetical protein
MEMVMKRGTKIAIGVASALSLGLAALAASAHPTGRGPGWDAGGTGWGQSMMGPMGMMGGPGRMGGGMGMMGGPNMMGMMGPGMMGGGPGIVGAHRYGIEERLTWQKGALKITPDQESAWQAYANTWRKYANALLAQRDAMHSAAPATAAERSELHNKLMKERFEQLEAVNAAYKSLYAVLTPEQRAVADQGP